MADWSETCCCAKSQTFFERVCTPSPRSLGATILVVGHETGSRSALFPLLAALACTTTRLLGVHYGLRLPIALSERHEEPPPI